MGAENAKENLVVMIFRNKQIILETAYDFMRGVEEDLLSLMDCVNPVLREDGKTYAYVLVIPYREGFRPGKEKPGFMLPTAWRFHSANIVTRVDGNLKRIRMRMPSFSTALVGDFIDDFKVYRGQIGLKLGDVNERFKKKLDLTRWFAAEHFGVHYRDVNPEQYQYQEITGLANGLVRDASDNGYAIDKNKLRDFLLEHVTRIPEESATEIIESSPTLKDLFGIRS